jgi:hypothetical protein
VSIVQVVAVANSEAGTGFCTEWNGRTVIATCDHLFLHLGPGLLRSVELELDGQRGFYDVRRHPTADVAIIDMDLGHPPLRRFPTLVPTAPPVCRVTVVGFPVGRRRTVRLSGAARGQAAGTNAVWDAAGKERCSRPTPGN